MMRYGRLERTSHANGLERRRPACNAAKQREALALVSSLEQRQCAAIPPTDWNAGVPPATLRSSVGAPTPRQLDQPPAYALENLHSLAVAHNPAFTGLFSIYLITAE